MAQTLELLSTRSTVTIMTPVRIQLEIPIRHDAEAVYAALCDWAAHSTWVPMTRVDVHSDDEFTAYTGVRPLVLEDRMRVTSRNDVEREVVVEKLGPVLRGSVLFRVEARGAACSVVWDEDLRVPFVPKVLAKPLGLAGAVLFKQAFRRFSRGLR